MATTSSGHPDRHNNGQNGIDILYHPRKGLLHSRNNGRKEAAEEAYTQTKIITEDINTNTTRSEVPLVNIRAQSGNSVSEWKAANFNAQSDKQQQSSHLHPIHKLATRVDNSGNHEYWRTASEHILYSERNQPRCNHCGVPSHGRGNGQRGKSNEEAGIFQVYHPDRGKILSHNQQIKRLQPPTERLTDTTRNSAETTKLRDSIGSQAKNNIRRSQTTPGVNWTTTKT